MQVAQILTESLEKLQNQASYSQDNEIVLSGIEVLNLLAYLQSNQKAIVANFLSYKLGLSDRPEQLTKLKGYKCPQIENEMTAKFVLEMILCITQLFQADDLFNPNGVMQTELLVQLGKLIPNLLEKLRFITGSSGLVSFITAYQQYLHYVERSSSNFAEYQAKLSGVINPSVVFTMLYTASVKLIRAKHPRSIESNNDMVSQHLRNIIDAKTLTEFNTSIENALNMLKSSLLTGGMPEVNQSVVLPASLNHTVGIATSRQNGFFNFFVGIWNFIRNIPFVIFQYINHSNQLPSTLNQNPARGKSNSTNRFQQSTSIISTQLQAPESNRKVAVLEPIVQISDQASDENVLSITIKNKHCGFFNKKTIIGAAAVLGTAVAYTVFLAL